MNQICILNDYLSIQETKESRLESKDRANIIVVESELIPRPF